MTRVSVGPAKRSMPTRPKSWRLASATNMLPGPTSMSTGAMDAVPIAIAATACTPPSARISSAPAKCIAATIAGCGSPWKGGAVATMRPTPATLAVSTLMCADAIIGYLPPGT